MNKMSFKKQAIALGLMLICLCGFLMMPTAVLPVWAETSQTPYEVLIDDKAELLTETEADQLLGYMMAMAEYGHVAYLSTSENEGSASDYSEAFYRDHWDGQPATIILLDLANGYLRIDNRGAIAEEIPDAYVEEISDSAIGFASNGEFYLAAKTILMEELAVMEGLSIESAVALAVPETQTPEETLAESEEAMPETEEASIALEPVVEENPETGYQLVFQDDAGLFTEDEIDALLEVMEPITDYGHAIFVSTNHNPDTQKQFCVNYLNERWPSGESLVMLLLDMDNRVIRLQTDGAIYEIVDEDYGDTITDNIYGYAGNGDYVGCVKEAFTETKALLEGHRIAQPMKYICNALLAMILAVVIMFFVVRRIVRQKAPSNDELIEYLEYSCAIDNMTKKYSRTIRHESSGGSSSGGLSGSSRSSGGWSGSSRSSGSSGSFGGGSRSSGSRSGGGGQHRF